MNIQALNKSESKLLIIYMDNGKIYTGHIEKIHNETRTCLFKDKYAKDVILDTDKISSVEKQEE